MKIGAQMFTLREHCQDLDGIARSCERVAKMGYDGLQGSAAKFNTRDLDEVKQIKRILDDNGLVCAATHEGLLNLESDDDVKAVVEKHQILDCKYTAIGGFFPKEAWTRQLWEDFAKRYNETAAKFAIEGILIGYHNHSHEFAPLDDGTLPMQLLLERLDEKVWVEFDTYWVQHGGGDPAAWIEKVAGRIPCVHYKDMSIDRERQHKMFPVGEGNLNWPRINEACRKAGVEWYLVERDAGDLDPFEALERSVKHMRSWGM